MKTPPQSTIKSNNTDSDNTTSHNTNSHIISSHNTNLHNITENEYSLLNPYHQTLHYIEKYNINDKHIINDYIEQNIINESFINLISYRLVNHEQIGRIYNKYIDQKTELYRILFERSSKNKQLIDVSQLHLKLVQFFKDKNYNLTQTLFNIINKKLINTLKQLLNSIDEKLEIDDILPRCDLYYDVITFLYDLLEIMYFYKFDITYNMMFLQDNYWTLFENILLNENNCIIKPIQRTNKIYIPISTKTQNHIPIPTKTQTYIPISTKTQNYIPIKTQIFNDQLELDVPAYNSYTLQTNIKSIKNEIIQHYTTGQFKFHIENYQHFKNIRTYDKHRLILLFEKLTYLLDCSEEYVQTFNFNIIKREATQQHEHQHKHRQQKNDRVKMNVKAYSYKSSSNNNRLQDKIYQKCGKCQKQILPNDSFIYGCCNEHICSECVKKQIFPHCMDRYPDSVIYKCPCCGNNDWYKTIYV